MVNVDDNEREYSNIFVKEDFEDYFEESTDDSECEQVSCTTSEDNAGISDDSSFGNNNKRKNKNMYIDDSSSSSNTSKLKATRTSKKNKNWFLFPYFHQKQKN